MIRGPAVFCATAIIRIWLAMLLMVGAGPVLALDDLMQRIVDLREAERLQHQQREATFLNARDRQRALTEEIEARQESLQGRYDVLTQQVAENASRLDSLRARLREEAGQLSDLGGSLRQNAADLQAYLGQSPAILLYPQYDALLNELQALSGLATTDDVHSLWTAMAQAIVDSAQVDRFEANVLGAEGTPQILSVTRLGPFSQIAGGAFLQWVPETAQLVQPEHQPPDRFLRQVAAFEAVTEGMQAVPLDPGRGTVLRLLSQTPDPLQRLQQGGVIGYIILGLGFFGVLFALWQYVCLTRIARSIRQQRRELDHPRSDNPLGRVLLAAQHPLADDPTSLERSLDEAILKELPVLERGRGLLKLLAAVAPMLGLLGTVTGMIATFQAISLFGTGDPRLMADGISEALVTTLLGLAVAVPLLFLHTLIASQGKELVQFLDEQSAGLVARQVERMAV